MTQPETLNDPEEENRNDQGEDNAADPKPRRIKLPPEAAERLRQQASVEGPRMLPGMAMIAIFLLVYALMNVVAAFRGMAGTGATRYTTLAICTMLVVGVFGLLRLKRWGWALMLGGTLVTALSYVIRFLTLHLPLGQGVGLLVWAGFFTIFFLYLVRDEVRIRVH